MQRFVLLCACIVACAGIFPFAARVDSATTAPQTTPPPQIYHVVTTALCVRLHETIRPAVAMVLENDQAIAKSQPLFTTYRRAMFENGTASSANDSINNISPASSMALQRMSYLVLPMARNIISAQTLVDDEKFLRPTGSDADDATLAQIKRQLLETVAFQSASLDIINGFVQTQQMGEIQHAGEEYIGAIQGTGSTTTIAQNTPNPWQDPNTPGLAPNPYAFDPAQIPGLVVGYNPISNLVAGLNWVQSETAKREDAVGKTISAALSQCSK